MASNERDQQAVNWRKELEDLKSIAKTPEENEATEAFARAIGPYLDDPTLLRTLLGKIQAPMATDEVAIVVDRKKFGSLDEVRAMLSGDVNVITL